MSSRIVMSIVLMIGIGIGSIVPAATDWWYDNHHASIALDSINAEPASTNDALTKLTYYFEVEQGVLSVLEGSPGASGRVITTFNVQTWPKEVLDMAPKVELYSLDEVQSFIDTVSELVQLKLNLESSVGDSTPTEAEPGVPLPLEEVGVSRLKETL